MLAHGSFINSVQYYSDGARYLSAGYSISRWDSSSLGFIEDIYLYSGHV